MKRVSLRISDLKIGSNCSNTVKVTDDLLDQFIAVSGDNSLIHQDEDYAKKAKFESRVIHGALISSFFSSLIGTQLPGDSALLLEISCKFHHPAFVNETLHLTAEITDIHENMGCISISLKALDNNHKKLSTGKALVKIRP